MDHPCSHLDWLRVPEPPAGGSACADCARAGGAWVHLRMCLTCGYIGCCDASNNRHASAHFTATGHPLMRSLEPGEKWAWCHLDRFAFPLDGLSALRP